MKWSIRKCLYELKKIKEYTLTIQITTLEDKNNLILGRREIRLHIKDHGGKLSRKELNDIVKKEYAFTKEYVLPISIKPETGKQDLKATVYVFNSEEEAKKQLPRYKILRNLSKEDRKKIIDEEKAAKLKAKQAAAAESKGNKKR